MSLTANFSSSEDITSNNLVTFNDTSTGSDGTIVTRRVYVLLSDGTYLVPAGTTTSYFLWDYANASIQVDLLSKSTSAAVTVEWWSSTAKVYTLTIDSEWDLYDYVFLFGLLSAQTSYPAVNANQGYWPNSWYMCTNLFQSENAITKMNDVYSSQSALDRNQLLINNQSLYF